LHLVRGAACGGGSAGTGDVAYGCICRANGGSGISNLCAAGSSGNSDVGAFDTGCTAAGNNTLWRAARWSAWRSGERVDAGSSGYAATGNSTFCRAARRSAWRVDSDATISDSTCWPAREVDSAESERNGETGCGATAAVQCMRRRCSAEPHRGHLHAMRMAAPTFSRLSARSVGVFMGAGRAGDVEVTEHLRTAHGGKDCFRQGRPALD